MCQDKCYWGNTIGDRVGMAEGSTPNTDTVNVPLAGRKRQLPMMDGEQVAAK
jgi:hypothetical protein